MIKLIKKFFIKFPKKSKKYKIIFILSLVFYIFLLSIVTIKVPYEIVTPGAAGSALEGIQIGDEKNTTNIYSLGIYTKKNISILEKWMALVNKKIDLEPYDKSTDLSPTEYYQFGKTMMDIGNTNSIIVAYEEYLEKNDPISYNPYIPSKIKFEKQFKGIVVTARPNYDNIGVRPNDIITKINDKMIYSIADLREELIQLTTGPEGQLNVMFSLTRFYKTSSEYSTIVDHKINYYTENDRLIFNIGLGLEEFFAIDEIYPMVYLQETNSIGSSGSIMTALAIYEIISEENITKGYKIVGTGSLNHDGKVTSIGGIKQKIYTAATKGYGFDIFFVPDDNYEEALEAYDMIFENNEPTFILKNINTFDDVLLFLDSLEVKNG